MNISRESVMTTEYGILKSHDSPLYVHTLILDISRVQRVPLWTTMKQLTSYVKRT